MQVQELIASTGTAVALQTTDTTIGSGTITLPSGWTSMRLVVGGHLLLVSGVATDPRASINLSVNAVDYGYGIFSFKTAATDEREMVPISSYISAAATGDVAWVLEGTVTTGSNNDVDVNRRSLHVVKYRLS